MTIDQRGAVTGMGSSSGVPLAPTSDATHMPFRVMVTYSHDGKVSSDPSLVSGVDGTVGMDVTIYNTTGRLETVSADVDGHSISREALISTPMTMAGSAVLDGVDPSKVVTAANRSKRTDPAGNGVVGVNESGKTVVQWAALTGIDPLGSVARFSLVVNAHDFHVPTMNLAVTPGFGVQDVGTKDENALVVSTIKTLTATSQVLDDSGKAVQLASQRLNEAGSNIGDKTINDLKASSARIGTNAQVTAETVSQLAGQTSVAYHETGSLISGQLAQATATMRDLLGDPRSNAPQVSVDSPSCKIKASDESSRKAFSGPEAHDVLGVIHGLSARLDALSKTSGKCQELVTADLISFLGPTNPDAKTCAAKAGGLSCALYAQKERLSQSMEDLTSQNVQLAAQLRNGSQGKMLASVQRLRSNFNDLQRAVDDLSTDSPQAYGESLRKMDVALAVMTGDVTEARTDLDQIHTKLQDELSLLDEQDHQITAVKREICLASGQTMPAREPSPAPGPTSSASPTPTPSTDPSATPSRPTQHAIDRKEGARLVDMLSSTTCPIVDPGPDVPFEGHRHLHNMANLADTDSQIRSGIEEAVKQTDIHKPGGIAGSRVARKLDDLEATLKILETNLHKAEDQRNTGITTLAGHIQSINNHMAATGRQLQDLEKNSAAVGGELSTLGTDLDGVVVSTRRAADEELTNDLATSLKGVGSIRNRGQQAVGQMFGEFTNNLTEQSGHVAAEGERTVGLANEKVESTNGHLAGQMNNLMQVRSAEARKTADGAVADTEQVSKLLSGDIARVLDDIGQHTHSGGGLLGAISTSASYLTVADNKVADANTQTHVAQSTQRTVYGNSQVDGAARRASLARLETPLTIGSHSGTVSATWMSARIEGRAS
ncbi:hypothetical protein FYJ43_02120 [Cutibacterium sp. WCA-380-WT-3A]|uniref:Uncharacterized protein n=1 Tax=Cutibacterium porci TaxID=2605781 RepID=A0A7K0J4M8_9ACTN|nr:hypothetical protein [Cutibacterium porci]MSS44872.1 hypothetical protein [Cutibacterium porci]